MHPVLIKDITEKIKTENPDLIANFDTLKSLLTDNEYQQLKQQLGVLDSDDATLYYNRLHKFYTQHKQHINKEIINDYKLIVKFEKNKHHHLLGFSRQVVHGLRQTPHAIDNQTLLTLLSNIK